MKSLYRSSEPSMTKIAESDRQKLADLYAGGMTQAAIAAAFGISRARVCQIVKTPFVKAPSGPNRTGEHNRKVSADQRKEVVEMFKDGSTLSEIGAKFGVSPERIRQIVKLLGVEADSGGIAVRALKSTADKVAAKRAKNERAEEQCRASWGMSLGEYRAHVAKYGTSQKKSSPMHRYVEHKRNALGRGIEWQFTFAQWWQVWQDSGKWEERGRTGYVMARYGDGDAPYGLSTVYICTSRENIKDSYIVHPTRRAGVRPAADGQAIRIQQMRVKRPPGRKTKITADEARSIRADRRPGVELAAIYGISTATVSQIKSRKIWKHV
jgi:transposase